MNGRQARAIRREERNAALEASTEELARSAYQNEQLTRQRVEALENLLRRGFLGRLRWLITGR